MRGDLKALHNLLTSKNEQGNPLVDINNRNVEYRYTYNQRGCSDLSVEGAAGWALTGKTVNEAIVRELMNVKDENGNVLLDFTRLQSNEETYLKPSTLKPSTLPPSRRILDVISRRDMTADLKLLLLDNVVKQFEGKSQKLKIKDRDLLKFYSLDKTPDRKHFVGLLNMLPIEERVSFMMDKNIFSEKSSGPDSAFSTHPPVAKGAFVFGESAANKEPAHHSSFRPGN